MNCFLKITNHVLKNNESELKMMSYVLKMTSHVLKNDDLCIENDECHHEKVRKGYLRRLQAPLRRCGVRLNTHGLLSWIYYYALSL